MSGLLLETALRPVRIAFLLGHNPSNKLINSAISVSSGLWGGICNIICPTDGAAITDEYLKLIQIGDPDCIVLCGRFSNRQNILRQLKENSINPSFCYTNISMSDIKSFGIGIEGIFDSKFIQNWQRGALLDTAVVNPLNGRTTLFDKFMFGIPSDRIKKYIENRVDFITVNRYNRESKRSDSDYDELIGIIQITREGVERYRIRHGRRFFAPRYGLGTRYYVLGREDNLNDICYFWNCRAIFGSDVVHWLPLNDLASFIQQLVKVTRPSSGIRVSITAISEDYRKKVASLMKGLTLRERPVRFLSARTVFNFGQNWTWKSEIRRDHLSATGDEFIIPTRRPSSFSLIYPQRCRWVMDCRIVKDDAMGTEGFVLPNLPYLANLMIPIRSGRLHPRIFRDVFSLQVTSAPIDENIRIRIPIDWEVIQSIFSQSNHNICLSDQGNYMNRALSLFGGLSNLSSLLRDKRVITILDEFLKHHHTGERVTGDGQYRRALTLSNMQEAVLSLQQTKTRKRRNETYSFIDRLLIELIQLGAIYSGYVLNCPDCKLEDWYPIYEVTETFRCRRCFAVQIRPPSPSISFRLNEALYQAYLNNFTVPTLVLDVLKRSSEASFIFSPQLKLDLANEHSPEVDIAAICDGMLLLGEAKSTNKIKKEQFSTLESIALGIKAGQIVFGTTSRDSCDGTECNVCSKQRDYADNAFSHGSTSDTRHWGTSERIKDLRERLRKQAISVISICSEDMLQGAIKRNRARTIFVPTRRLS